VVKSRPSCERRLLAAHSGHRHHTRLRAKSNDERNRINKVKVIATIAAKASILRIVLFGLSPRIAVRVRRLAAMISNMTPRFNL
jgi:hypothetical protein